MKEYKIYQLFSKNFLKFFLFLSLSLFLSNCGKPGQCIKQEDVGGISFNIDAQNDGNFIIDQGYINSSGGQRAAWFDTGYKTNGDEFHIEISGNWTAWFGDETEDIINELATPDYKLICDMGVVNEGSTSLGIDGEFDYIKNTHRLLPNQQKIRLRPEEQEACWLTQGEGLYIGFFGPDGFDMPEVVHHLKIQNADDIRCDSEFRHDLNENGKIEFNECYEEKEANIRINKAIAIYKIPNFVKKLNGEMVSKNEVVKLIILDKYYSDNIGGYKVTFYRGIGSKTKGTFEKIIEDIEDIFLGKVNQITQKRENGIIYKIYNQIVLNTLFSNVIRIALVLYIAFLGFGIMTGSIELNKKELLTRLFKLSFIIVFTTPNGWRFFNDYIMTFFFDGVASVNNVIQSIMYSSPAMANKGSVFSYASSFSFIDYTFNLLLNPFSSASLVTRIPALVLNAWYGTILAISLYIIIFFYLYALVTMIFPYIIALVQVTLALSISPIFIAFYLFEQTKHMFKAWLIFISARFFEMSILFIFLSLMNSIIINRLIKLLSFEPCYVSIKEIAKSGASPLKLASLLNVFGLNFAVLYTDEIENPEAYFVELIILFVLILLFKHFATKLLAISNSLFTIWGEQNKYVGGGLGGQKGFLPSIIGKTTKKYFRKITSPIISEGKTQRPESKIEKAERKLRAKFAISTMGKAQARKERLSGLRAEERAEEIAKAKLGKEYDDIFNAKKADRENRVLRSAIQNAYNQNKEKLESLELDPKGFTDEVKKEIKRQTKGTQIKFTDKKIGDFINLNQAMLENQIKRKERMLNRTDKLLEIAKIEDPENRIRELQNYEKEMEKDEETTLLANTAKGMLENEKDILAFKDKKEEETFADKKAEFEEKIKEVQEKIKNFEEKVTEYKLQQNEDLLKSELKKDKPDQNKIDNLKKEIDQLKG